MNLNDYFVNKNYVAIYLHNFFNTFGKSITSIFSAVLFYQIGFPIYLILLFFGFKFGLMGLLSPLSPIFISKLNLVKTIIISNIFLILGIVFLLVFNQFSNNYLFFIFIFFSFNGAIFHPIPNAINAKYIKNRHKGRVNSLITIIKALSSALAVFIIGQLLTDHKYILLFIILISFILAILPYIFILEKKKLEVESSFVEIYKYLFSNGFRENILPFSMQTFIIIEHIFISLFIYIFVGDIKVVSYIITISILIELVITFLFAKKIDFFEKESFFDSVLLKSLTSIFFLFFNFHTFLLFINQTYSKITQNLFDNSFKTLIQKKSKKTSPILFSTAKEMILCFTEFFILIIFSIVAYYVQEKVFIGIFLSSFIGIWIIYYSWKK